MEIPKSYKSLTEIAKKANKRLDSWINYPVGQRAIADFKAQNPKIDRPIIVVRGQAANKGTWAHPELAAMFAVWCDPRFVKFLLNPDEHTREDTAIVKDEERFKALQNLSYDAFTASIVLDGYPEIVKHCKSICIELAHEVHLQRKFEEYKEFSKLDEPESAKRQFAYISFRLGDAVEYVRNLLSRMLVSEFSRLEAFGVITFLIVECNKVIKKVEPEVLIGKDFDSLLLTKVRASLNQKTQLYLEAKSQMTIA